MTTHIAPEKKEKKEERKIQKKKKVKKYRKFLKSICEKVNMCNVPLNYICEECSGMLAYILCSYFSG